MAPFRPGVVIQYPVGALESPNKTSVGAATVYDPHAPFTLDYVTAQVQERFLRQATNACDCGSLSIDWIS